MKEEILFKETQHSVWLKILFLVITLAHIFILIFASEEVSPFLLISLAVLFAFVAIVFTKITLILTSEKIQVKFGLGLFKRSIPVKEIDFSSVKIEDAPLLYGIGLRITPKGRLYNLRPGKAIWLKSTQLPQSESTEYSIKNPLGVRGKSQNIKPFGGANKIIFVVTDKAEQWKEEILKLS